MSNKSIHFVLVIIISLLNIIPSEAQKEDFVWTFGYAVVVDSLSANGGTNIDFNTNPPTLYRVNRKVNFLGTSSSFCDKNGNLVLVSNGCQITDGKDNLLPSGGEKLLAGDNSLIRFHCLIGMTLYFSTVFLPVPESKDDCVALFHFSIRQTDLDEENRFMNDTMFMTTICKNPISQEFEISKLKEIVDIQNFMTGNFTAVRHANGKDWWLIQKVRRQNKFLLYLISNNGEVIKNYQNIGPPDLGAFCYSQNKFSPDGRKYAWFDPCIGLYIMDFDRRSGTFSNPVLVPTWTNFNIYSTGGMEFSPNSRFIYCTTGDSVWQIDLHSADLAKSNTLVQVWDGYKRNGDGLEVNFVFAQLGPDGRIYISNGTNYIHYINKPNLKGAACDFRQRGILAPTLLGWVMPYFPNYRLGPMPDKAPGQGDFLITPSPASDQITIYSDMSYAGIKMFDIAGKEFYVAFDGAGWADISDIPQGVYVVALYNDSGQRLAAKRFVKI